ncbi:MAG: polysaccharide biosynthesis/export family protein [Phycisphaerae bacterium]|jgi:protein involved in polysaccharide export with SLBB domain
MALGPRRDAGRAVFTSLSVTLLALGACNTGAKKVSFIGSPFDPDRPKEYVLYPGDVLMVRFPSDPDLDQQVRVRADGKISLPHVGDIQTAQRSPEAVANELASRLTGVLETPEVSLIVVEEAGRRVYVGGEVLRPGGMALQPKQTLGQAVIQAGGFRSTAHTSGVLVIRNRPRDGTFVLKVDLGEVFRGAEPDTPLEPYDIVYVPETVIARVDRFVDQYINQVIPRAVGFSFLAELTTRPVEVVEQSRLFTTVPSVR